MLINAVCFDWTVRSASYGFWYWLGYNILRYQVHYSQAWLSQHLISGASYHLRSLSRNKIRLWSSFFPITPFLTLDFRCTRPPIITFLWILTFIDIHWVEQRYYVEFIRVHTLEHELLSSRFVVHPTTYEHSACVWVNMIFSTNQPKDLSLEQIGVGWLVCALSRCSL